ncbi:MAG TPA: Rieske 2Fe-2S domain-containing protein [Pseudosphingobacterium sp.]|nr:Rieske 2Fe-2S domain-containing protein [Pseudosphingobacterium sp.]
MKEWHKIDSHLLPDTNTITKIKLVGKTICLINDGNKLYATGSKCPHAGADLSLGWCEKGQLVCPYHRHAFNLENGRGAEGQGNYVTVYPLKKEDEEWFIKIKVSLFRKLFGKEQPT